MHRKIVLLTHWASSEILIYKVKPLISCPNISFKEASTCKVNVPEFQLAPALADALLCQYAPAGSAKIIRMKYTGVIIKNAVVLYRNYYDKTWMCQQAP